MKNIYQLMPSLAKMEAHEEENAIVKMCIAHVLNGGEYIGFYDTAIAYLGGLAQKEGNVEIKVSLPREDLISLARLATSRNEATRDTASKIIREYVAAQQSMHLTAFGVGGLGFIAGFGICWLAFVR